MDNTTILFIRACKSQDSIKRLRSVYRRFYGAYGEVSDISSISDLLVHIVDEVSPMSLSEYLRDVSSYRSYYNVAVMCNKSKEPIEKDPEYLTTLYIMRDKLRYICREDLVKMGCPTPARFRNKS